MSPCLWTLDTSCCQATWNGADAALQARAEQYATMVLWAATGRRYGPCAITVRPCNPQRGSTYQTYGMWLDAAVGGTATGWMPFAWDGAWRNCGCGPQSCVHDPAAQVWLPGPVAAISEVRVNNVVITSTAYRVDDGAWLVRQDGGTWPQSQDFGQPAASATDTFLVTYLRGELVPDGGAAAAGALACEYVKMCQGGPCRFPKRVTSVSRQGVSVSANETIQSGETGLPEVDAWVRALNPRKLVQRSRAYSTDLDEARVTTWG